MSNRTLYPVLVRTASGGRTAAINAHLDTCTVYCCIIHCRVCGRPSMQGFNACCTEHGAGR